MLRVDRHGHSKLVPLKRNVNSGTRDLSQLPWTPTIAKLTMATIWFNDILRELHKQLCTRCCARLTVGHMWETTFIWRVLSCVCSLFSNSTMVCIGKLARIRIMFLTLFNDTHIICSCKGHEMCVFRSDYGEVHTVYK